MNVQQQAALDTHVHCAVLANAGAGKTQVLVQRFLRILVLENVEIDSVVAITFTRAAAMEMRQRLHQLIESILNGTEDPAPYLGEGARERHEPRLRRLLVQIGSARISTFHSFCAGLVRQYADVVGRSSDVKDADEKLSSELCLEAIDAAMQHFLAEQQLRDARVQTVFDTLSVSTIQTQIAMLTRTSADRRNLLSVLSESDDDAIARRRGVVQTMMTDALKQLVPGIRAHMDPWRSSIPELNTLDQTLAHLNGQLQAGDASVQDAMISTLEGWFTQDYSIRKSNLGKQSKSGPLPDALAGSLVRIADFIRAPWNDEAERHQLTVAQGLAVVAERSAQQYAEIKRRRNVMDFDDMIDDAKDLLGNPDVASAIRASITHIMIDEFQDTDPTQFELLELLAPALRDATSVGPNVFIVGDDKQSIYGFRNADVRLFRRARRAIRNANSRATPNDSGLRPLTQSYRMHQDLAASVNLLCRRAFDEATSPDDDDDVSFDVAYMDLEAAITRPSDARLSSTVILEMTEDDLTQSSEFEYLARQLALMLTEDQGAEVFDKKVDRRPARPGDIAVLVPSNENKNRVADALRRHGLPFTIYSGRSFFSRPEIADVRAALTAAVDPGNDLATATAMRSPLLRCPDIDIVRASLLGRKSSLQDGLSSLVLSGSASPESVAARAFFEELRGMIALQPVSEVIEPMLQICGWHAAVGADPRYRQMLANIEKLIGLCMKAEQSRSASLVDVLDAIKEPARDLEAEGTVMSDDDAIHVMTIHASKGLEFPIVALAGLSMSSRTDSFIISQQIGPTTSTPEKLVAADNALAIVSRPLAASHVVNRMLDDARLEAERRRLLYVALTRAKAHLVLCLPAGEAAGSATGLSRMLVDATTPGGPWKHVACSELAESTSHGVAVQMGSPLSAALPPLQQPSPIILTASALLHRATSAPRPVRRRLVGAETSATVYGSAVHDALAELLRSIGIVSIDDMVERIVGIMKRHELDRDQARQAVEEVLSVLGHPLVHGRADALRASTIEGALVALHGETLIEGVLDVRLDAGNGAVEVWDWKTNAVRSAAHMKEIAESYAAQMKTYAWLCLQATPQCTGVVTRLVFTKAAAAGYEVIDVATTWTPESLSLPVSE